MFDCTTSACDIPALAIFAPSVSATSPSANMFFTKDSEGDLESEEICSVGVTNIRSVVGEIAVGMDWARNAELGFNPVQGI